ncbi:hypothetical protein [Cohnella sp. 56]|uniref:hypothetical protein n=1 Tax=Cohnella sp. 56 TaxID=3113722 RepID=UPI0030E7C191
MRTLLDIFGYIILLFGTLLGAMSGSLILIVVSIVGGLLLLALSHLIGIAENVQARLLDLPPTLNTVRAVVQGAAAVRVEAEDIELYPAADAKYELIELDDEQYMRTKAFRHYLAVMDSRYTFSLPNRPSITLHCAYDYDRGIELFALDGQSFVMLKAIGVEAVRDNGVIRLYARSGEDDEGEV